MPGIEVPEALIEEVAGSSDIDATSTAIAARIVAGLVPLCQGVHLVPLGREALVPVIVGQAGLSECSAGLLGAAAGRTKCGIE